MFKTNFIIVLWASVVSILMQNSVLAYPNRVPTTPRVCAEMKPGHGPESKPLPGPFMVSPSQGGVKPGETLNVTLKGRDQSKTMFKGFFLQGRDESSKPVGEFIANAMHLKDYAIKTCGQNNNVVHHVNRNPKDSVTVVWKAPSGFAGKLTFMATFVENFSSFYVKVPAEMIVTIG